MSPTGHTSEGAARARGMPLVAVAAGLALLWIGILALSIAIESRTFVALGASGLVLTALAIGYVDRHQRQLRALAETDTLTSLINHGGFHTLLQLELRAAARAGQQLSVVNLDLDDFKAINDTYGHPYGDDVLRRIGDQLRAIVRDADTPARIGGEEFALVLPGTSSEDAVEIAERARAVLRGIELPAGKLNCSAGVATYPDDASDAGTLLELADGALYSAKRAGKRRTRSFDPHRIPRNYTGAQRTQLRRLLDQPDRLRAAYQPVVALATGRVIGYEALARIDSDPPRPVGTWFAEANGCGLGPELEAAAIRAALEPIGRPAGTHLAVNVSPSALGTPQVQSALPADLTDLVIEITEHEAIADDESLAQALLDIRERGALIALDDAGAGYSGLKQLARLKPDIVKLDRNLIDGVNADPARLALIESFVRFSNRIGATVCAEGIETLDELAAVADLDVQWGQGFVLARPDQGWPSVAERAVRTCHSGLRAALKATTDSRRPLAVAGERGLEAISAALGGARSRADLRGALGLIAAELHAGEISLSQWHPERGELEVLASNHGADFESEPHYSISDFPLTEKVLGEQRAAQVLVGDPGSDPHEVELLLELGHRSLLMVPVVLHGAPLGLLEAFSGADRAWTRTEINHARIVANQFASVINTSFTKPRRGDAAATH